MLRGRWRMRIVLGVLLFGGFVMFVTPVTVVGMLSSADAPKDLTGLVNFGLGAALVFGIPGYFAFPWERRLQAVAWLAAACLAYGGFLVGVLSFIQANPAIMSDPGARTFFGRTHFRLGPLAVIAAVLVAIFLALFRRNRVAATSRPPVPRSPGT